MKSIVLFSGGLDSSLAVKILQKQNVEITALNIVTPFHDNSETAKRTADALDIELVIHRTGDEYVQMLAQPKWGYAKAANPCIDCRLEMLRTAKTLMSEQNADFIATGEIAGQDPNSQMQHQLNLMTREARLEGLLLRPLCAQKFPPTEMETSGSVDRSQLGAYTGKGRGKLVVLAHRLGIKKIPPPSARCILCEKSYAPRVFDLFKYELKPTDWDAAVLNTGRQLRLDENTRAVVARNEEHCQRMEEVIQRSDMRSAVFLKPENFIGPSVLVIGTYNENTLPLLIERGKALAFQYTNPAKYDPQTAAFEIKNF